MSSAKPHSAVLERRMQLTCGRLYATYRRFWDCPDLHALVPNFLVLMHQIVRASVPLMQTASTVAQRLGADAVCRALCVYLPVHIDEERHHDEWILEDLEAIGLPPARVLGVVPPPGVAALVGAQYYWVQHAHPVALLGYMRLLEGNAPSTLHIDALMARTGLPAEAFRTYRLHGTLDPHHSYDLDAFLDSLPLSDSQATLIWVSAAHTARALADCLEALESSPPLL